MGEFQNIVLWLAGGAAVCVVFTLLAGRFCGMSSLSPPNLGQEAQARKAALDAQREADKKESANCGFIRPGEWQCNCNSAPCKVRPHERTEDRVPPTKPGMGRRAAIEATKRKHEARDAS